jgi:hypothetical protein
MRQRHLDAGHPMFPRRLSGTAVQDHAGGATSSGTASCLNSTGRLRDYFDLMPRNDPSPKELTNRLFRREAGGQVNHRRAPGPAVRDLGWGEQSLFKTGVAGDRPLEPPDLHQIETDQSSAHRYSTVTVLARLRGWSTFSPRHLAT